MVVERDSATLGYPGEISSPLNADHHNVCKFDSTQDSNYISVRDALQKLVATMGSTGMFNDTRYCKWIQKSDPSLSLFTRLRA